MMSHSFSNPGMSEGPNDDVRKKSPLTYSSTLGDFGSSAVPFIRENGPPVSRRVSGGDPGITTLRLP
jgi:hypothetical protein